MTLHCLFERNEILGNDVIRGEQGGPDPKGRLEGVAPAPDTEQRVHHPVGHTGCPPSEQNLTARPVIAGTPNTPWTRATHVFRHYHQPRRAPARDEDTGPEQWDPQSHTKAFVGACPGRETPWGLAWACEDAPEAQGVGFREEGLLGLEAEVRAALVLPPAADQQVGRCARRQ